jgi:hypothetical protein
MIAWEPSPDGIRLPVQARPGARKNSVGGAHNGALRVSVTAPADRGKANDAIAALLAEALGLKRRQVQLVGGAASRRKWFLLTDAEPHDIGPRLEALAAEAG